MIKNHLTILVLSILPKGTVRDETTFFILVSILVALVIAAYVMRRRRNRQPQ